MFYMQDEKTMYIINNVFFVMLKTKANCMPSHCQSAVICKLMIYISFIQMRNVDTFAFLTVFLRFHIILLKIKCLLNFSR